jgi:glutaredoxin
MRRLLVALIVFTSPLLRAGISDIKPLSPAGQLGPAERMDLLADCLQRKGVTFYGAAWCPQCERQRHLFGAAASRLRYVECSTDGTKDTTAQYCDAADVRGFPTWVRADGARLDGFRNAAELARFSGCRLP